MTFIDEDKDQTHIISLVDDNEGRFAVSSSGVVTKATDDSLDTSKVYVIEAKVTDNGNPQQSVRLIVNYIIVLDSLEILEFYFTFTIKHLTENSLVTFHFLYMDVLTMFRVRVMVFNATSNNISIISWLSVLLVKETGIPGENHRPATSH